MCEIDAALPGTVHLIAKYPKDIETALIENIMAGEDSLPGASSVALSLAFSMKIEAIPQRCIEEMNALGKITAMVGYKFVRKKQGLVAVIALGS